jgi:hypothetical protein
MQRRPPPLGFILLGLMLAGLGAFLTLIVLEGEEGGRLPRLLVGAVAALSFLAAEALWFMRPWLVRAIDAWALTCPLAVIVGGVAVAVHDGFSLGDFLLAITLIVCFVVIPCALVRWYVRGHAAVVGLLPPLPGAAP